MNRKRVLHISADFPDSINPDKTPVIARLIDLVADNYDHRVLSLNRHRPAYAEAALLAAGVIDPATDSTVRMIDRGEAIAYCAPSYGVLHATILTRLAQWLAARVARQTAIPDLIIGHKLTVEGILAHKIAQHLNIPYAITIQGNTDEKILRFRPDLVGRFREIYHDASCVFCFAPWARAAVERRLGQRTGLTLNLPCPTVIDTIKPPVPNGNALVSVFHLRNHKIKNLAGLTTAMQLLATEGLTVRLEVFGGGNPAETAACQAVIARTGTMTLAGARTQDQLGTELNSAIALVMPSRRESFGLVFIEALFAGLPIIYPRGASVDGYFEGLPFAIAVDARNPREIADAIRRMTTHEVKIKSALAQWQDAGGLEPFLRKTVRAIFDHGLRHAITASKDEVPTTGSNTE